ncbi:hypothetical protein [Streptomyces sp. NPDC003247]
MENAPSTRHARFEAGQGPYAWTNHTLFVGDLRPPTRGDQVTIDVHRVM